MQLSTAIDEANRFARGLHDRKVRNDLRSRVAAACFAVAQQHHNAILILLSRDPPLEGTGLALLRPLLESVIRGLWISHVATDEQISRYVIGGVDMPMSKMTKSIDQVTGLNSHDSLYQKGWSALSAYTHTGEFQVQRWLKTQHVEPCYSEEEIAELIQFSSLAAGLAFEAMMQISIQADCEVLR